MERKKFGSIFDCTYQENLDFGKLYRKQYRSQHKLIDKGAYSGIDDSVSWPGDSPRIFSYHVQQLISEIGEVLEADKRWKNFRNDRYEESEKLDELADCFIVLLNMFIFSGFDAKEAYEAISNKLQIVSERINAIDDEDKD